MNKFLKELLISAVAIAVVMAGIYFYSVIFKKPFFFFGYQFLAEKEYQPPAAKPYKAVTEKPSGWFTTGQEADLVLSADDFNNSGGPSALNHPTKVATDGTRLIVADTYNHRVLIWNKIPENNNTPADLVIGQKDFTVNTPDIAGDKLRWPTGVATDGQRLVVADAYNERVLIWNTFPTANGQPADLVLGQPDFTSELEAFPGKITDPDARKTRHIRWPWDVMIYRDKLFVISLEGSLLIWNKFPTQNYAPADVVLGQKDFNERFVGDIARNDEKLYMRTPRSVSFDGNYLVVGDYNAKKIFIYRGLPEQSGQRADYIIDLGAHKTGTGVAAVAGKIYATMDNNIYVWREPITRDNQRPDFVLGDGKARSGRYSFNSPYGLATDGRRLIVADTNNSRVMIFNNLPEKEDDLPDVILGQKDFDTNRMVSRNSRNNPYPVTDGKILIVGDDYNGLVQVYNNLPDESLADADIYNISDGGTYCAYDGKLYCASRKGLSVWNKLPSEKRPPDFMIQFTILGPRGIAVDKNGLYVADAQGNRVFVFTEKPSQEKRNQPDFVLGQKDLNATEPGSDFGNLKFPIGVGSDNKRLVVGDNDNKRVLIWNLPIRENGQKPDLVLDGRQPVDIGPLRFEGPAGVIVYDDKLFLADNGNNRVLIWSKFPTKPSDQPDIVLGQKDFYSKFPSNAKDRMFLPMNIAFDGHYLWVGEFKWSDRLLRFSVHE